MKKTHDLVATVGKHTDNQGNEKKRYHKCGSAFTDDQGRLSIKIDGVPVGNEWSGWISLYEADRDRQQGQRADSSPGYYTSPGQPQKRDEFGDPVQSNDQIPGLEKGSAPRQQGGYEPF